MPTDAEILGFSNQWYSQALRYATSVEITEALTIRMVTGPYFLATIIAAFYSRGKGDFLASHDMEDIVTLLDGREELVAEVAAAAADVKDFLAGTFKEFLQHRDFLEALPGHLFPDPASQQRIPLLLERARNIARAKS